MLNNSRNVSQKVLVGFVSLAMATSLASCSKSKNSAEPSPSASVSVSASATVKPSHKPTHKPSHKPTVKPTMKPTPEATTDEPVKVDPTVKKPTVQTVKPKPPIKLDSKQQIFEKEFTRLTKLDPKTWDTQVDEQGPMFATVRYPEMLKYAKGALCSYIATGLDDITLGGYIGAAVTYDPDIQSALLKATRKAYGCKSA